MSDKSLLLMQGVSGVDRGLDRVWHNMPDELRKHLLAEMPLEAFTQFNHDLDAALRLRPKPRRLKHAGK